MLRSRTVLPAIVIFHFAVVSANAELIEQSTTSPPGATVPSAAPSLGTALPQAAPPSSAANNVQSANKVLLQQKLAELNRLQSEVEQLRAATGTPLQILVKMQVLEISRSKLRRLGVDWAMIGPKTDGKVTVQQICSLGDLTGSRVIDQSAAFLAFIAALRESRVAKVLAEPSIMTVSGRPASFNVGGELPIPSPPGAGKEVQFQTFGTNVDVLAITRGNNKIRLELRVRHSEPDYSHAIVIEGNRVPVMNVRQIDTAVELATGQTALLNGLVQQREKVLKLKSETKTEMEEVETWFIVTPEFVPSIASSPASVR